MPEADLFASLCLPTTVEDLAVLRRRIGTHVDAVEEAQFDVDGLDIDLARRMASVLDELADMGASLGPDQRALVRGAIDYFLLTPDQANDLNSPHGLADDRTVVERVCKELDRSDLLSRLG